LRFDLRTFACEHVGLSRSYDNSQLKRKLGKALAELEEIGFLLPQNAAERFTKLRRGEWQIALIRAGQRKSAELTGDDNEQGAVVTELLERGVHKSIVRQIARDIPHEKIQQKIAVYDWLMEKKGSRRPSNPAGFLAASIRNDYATPKDYVDKPNRPKPLKRKPNRAKRAAKPKDAAAEVDTAKRAAFEKYWQQLSATRQQRLEKEAMQEVDCLTLSVCERLQAKGGKMWDEMRLFDPLRTCREARAHPVVRSRRATCRMEGRVLDGFLFLFRPE